MKIIITAHVNNRKKIGVEKDMFGQMHVYTDARPKDGLANKSIREILAKHFNVPISKIILLKGQTGKIKTFEVGE